MRDKKTGKSRGFAFLAFVDQRSTDVAVDNMNGALVTNFPYKKGLWQKFENRPC